MGATASCPHGHAGADGLGEVRTLRFLDVDHDEDLDLLAAGTAGARLLRNDGTGTLQDLTGGRSSGHQPRSTSVGPISTATGWSTSSSSVPTGSGGARQHRGTPLRARAQPNFAALPGARTLGLGDYDNDGAIDVLVSQKPGGVTAWRNQGGRAFRPGRGSHSRAGRSRAGRSGSRADRLRQ
ncbi:MAG: hypothetical protein R2882_10815 [Gemmatimonadales bacterium]